MQISQNIFIFIIIILFFFYSSYSLYTQTQENILFQTDTNISVSQNPFYSSNITDNFFWPIPGFTKITSYFGKRTAPTVGASTSHSGIDIPAPEGTSLYSVLSGTVSYIGFKGAYGYTIIITSGNYDILYAHVSPNYIISKNQQISKGELIGFVGPKYIYDVINNPYSDSKGNPTNGATTGTHLHLTIKKDGIAVNPLNYFCF